MKKWIISIISLFILILAIYIAGKIYQDTTREILDVDKIKNISAVSDDVNDPLKGLVIKGTANLEKFEQISSISALKKQGVIYVYINTIKGFSSSDKFSQPLDKVLVNYDNTEVQEIVLISGKNMIVKNTGKGNVDSIEVDNYSKKKLIKKITE